MEVVSELSSYMRRVCVEKIDAFYAIFHLWFFPKAKGKEGP